MKKYLINEIFYSVQGEGMRMGTPNIFIRFSKCNMKCRMEEAEDSPGGFDCDTEFESGKWMHGSEIVDACKKFNPICTWVIATGGEPALQLDRELCDLLHEAGYKIAIETNGSVLVCGKMKDGEPILLEPNTDHNLGYFLADNFSVDWITVSPKVAEHAVKQRWAHEVKYVRGAGQACPKPTCFAKYQLVSPATSGLNFDQDAIQACVDIVLNNFNWRLSPQFHKIWSQR